MKPLDQLPKSQVAGDESGGQWDLPGIIPTHPLFVQASWGLGWDHVSVSVRGGAKRCPSWAELEHVKRLFFKDDETAMQLHVPPSEHINHHTYVLHLWRPQGIAIPMPPPFMV